MSKKQKVCVISSYAYIVNHVNYGALLQYFAVQNLFSTINCEAYWLRYCLDEDLTLKSKLKRSIKKLLFYKDEKEIENILISFQKFIINHLNYSSRIYYSEDELLTDCPSADIYVTGSDQVWGGILKPNYLCFVPKDKKKIAFSASFGSSSISKDKEKIIQPWLQNFDFISVRESSGVEVCKNMGIEAVEIIDPTLMIASNQYPTIELENSADVFCYFLNIKDSGEVFWNSIKKWCDRNNYSLKVSCTERTYSMFEKNYRLYLSPEEWLSYYKNSKYIFTNTFHGTVFAIIFNIPFIYIQQAGQSEKQNGRIISILKKFHLLNRILKNEMNINNQIMQEIDWTYVNKIKQSERNRIIEYLKEEI